MIFLLVSYDFSGFARCRQDPQDFREISVEYACKFSKFQNFDRNDRFNVFFVRRFEFSVGKAL